MVDQHLGLGVHRNEIKVQEYQQENLGMEAHILKERKAQICYFGIKTIQEDTQWNLEENSRYDGTQMQKEHPS